MPFSELPLSLLFLLFLLLFVVIGVYPRLRIAATKFRQLLNARNVQQESSVAQFKRTQPGTLALSPTSAQLNSYENIIFRQLAQAHNRGLSRKQLGAALHLGPVSVQQALQLLHRRGLIRVATTPLLSVCFSLSKKGNSYAIKHDLIPKISNPSGSP